MLRLAIHRTLSLAVACVVASLLAAAFAAGKNGADSLTPAELLTPSTAVYVEISEPKALLDLAWSERTTALLEKLPQVQKAYQLETIPRSADGCRRAGDEASRHNWKAAVSTLTGGGVTLAFDAPSRTKRCFSSWKVTTKIC